MGFSVFVLVISAPISVYYYIHRYKMRQSQLRNRRIYQTNPANSPTISLPFLFITQRNHPTPSKTNEDASRSNLEFLQESTVFAARVAHGEL